MYFAHRDVELADTLGQEVFGCRMIVYLEGACLKEKIHKIPYSPCHLLYTIIKPFIDIHYCSPSLSFILGRGELILTIK